jgi:uronate dehydrogenase
MQRILITGAAGTIGRVLREGLRGRYPVVRLTDRAPLGAADVGEEIVENLDLADLDGLEAAMRDVDAVVHLGGTPVEQPWEPVLNNNIVGLYNTYEAARRAGVRRIVFASSNHTVGFHPRGRHIDETVPVRPDGLYGVSKVFAEALGRLYADKHGLEIVNLRIGSFQPRPKNIRMLNTWLSHGDCVHLVDVCLRAPGLHFEIIYGVSANARNRWHDSLAARIGYRPQDNAEDYADEILAAMTPEDEPLVERMFHGGEFCDMGFEGDLAKIG